MEKAIAIITARGGSKRIPRKNIRDFCGRPILTYSIEAALSSDIFDEVMVSTEDTEIAGIAAQYGAKVPFLRSAGTADDYATTADVLMEVLTQYRAVGREFQFACCIYPTAPFVTAAKIKQAMKCLEESGADSVLPVTAFSFPPMRGFLLEAGEAKYAFPEYASRRSQDIQPMYYDCGQFYCFQVRRFLESRQLVTAHTRAMIVPEMEVQDIDSEQDWRLAELKYRLMKEKAEDRESPESSGHVLQGGRAAVMGEGRHCFLREAKWEDMEQLFLWANDKEVRKNSFSMEPISYEEHQEWYEKKLEKKAHRCIFCVTGLWKWAPCAWNMMRKGQKSAIALRLNIEGTGMGRNLFP